MDKLPQELIDKITDSFDRSRPDGLAALLACSRVTRAWRLQAQKKILSCVCVWHVDCLKALGRDVSLQSKIPSYVRYLIWGLWHATKERPSGFLEDRFVSFSNVETLLLLDFSLEFLDTAAIQRTFSHLARSLRSLQIFHLTTDPDKWCLLVSLLPNLERIDISNATMLEGGGSDPSHPRSFDFTGHVAPYQSGTEKFFRCIASLNPRFESLQVRGLDDTLVNTLNLVVRSCSATLTTLSITPEAQCVEGNPSVHPGSSSLTSFG